MPFVRSPHASHPSPSISYSHNADDALDTRIDRPNPNDRGATVAGAVDAETIWIDLGLQSEKRQRRLHVSHSAIGRQPTARSLARAPTLVVEGEHDVTGVIQLPGIVG